MAPADANYTVPLYSLMRDWKSHRSAPRPSAFELDVDQCNAKDAKSMLRAMAVIDWAYVLSLAAGLAIGGGAICILLFAM